MANTTSGTTTFDKTFSVDEPAYVIPSDALGLIVIVFCPSGALFANLNEYPTAIAGKVNTTPSVSETKVFPESAVVTV